LPVPLDPEDAEKFPKTGIDGSVFLEGVGGKEFFQNTGLSLGTNVKLAKLAREMGRKSKYFLLYHGRHADSQFTVS
jgi:hypothetical protein